MEYIQMLFKKRRESNNPSHYRKSLIFNINYIIRTKIAERENYDLSAVHLLFTDSNAYAPPGNFTARE